VKTLKNILTLVVLVTIFTAWKNETQPEIKTIEVETTSNIAKKELNPNATYAKAEFSIAGMTCKIGCAKTIEKKIATMDGVKYATVDFDRNLAMVEYDEALVNPNSLEETVTNLADIYKVSDMKVVENFSEVSLSKDKECKAKYTHDCTKKDCAKCIEKSAECKKKCDAMKSKA
jgi:copper chaperone CopZ